MLNTQQTKIYEGLKQIGEAIANFYSDALVLIEPSCKLPSKANLIAHLAREIDGGLRDAFSPVKKKVEKEKALKEKGLKDMGHFASILVLLGKDDINDSIAKEWFEIAKEFPAMAHRHEIFKSSLDSNEIIELWNKYEKILFIVIGSNLSITNRLDGFIRHTPPTGNTFQILKNIISISKNAFYFFQNLSEESWLDTLTKEEYFIVESAPKIKEDNVIEEWFSLRYLLNISTTENYSIETEITKIVEQIMHAYNADLLALHPFSITNFIEIIVRLKHYSFNLIVKQFFTKLHLKADHSTWSLYNHNLLDKMPMALLAKSDAEGIKELLTYAFGFSTQEKPGISFEGLKLPAQTIIQPFVEDFALSEFLKNYAQGIIELIKTEALFICIEKIKSISGINQMNFSSLEISSIEISSQTHYSNHWQANLINFIRDSPSFLSKEDTQILVKELIESDLKILQRLGVHIIRIHYEDLQVYWWDYIIKNPIDDIVTHEPYILIKEHSKKFNEEQIKKTIAWIEDIKERHFDVENYSGEKHRQYNIRKWLEAFDEQIIESNTFLNEKFKYYNQVNDWKIEHPEFDSYSTFTVGHQYPVSIDEFEKLSIPEQLSYLNNFKPDHNYTEEGLAELLRQCVVKNPDNYLLNLNQFFFLPSVYVNELIEGVTISIRNNKIIDYKPVLNFIKQKVATDDFINEVTNHRNYKRWLVASLCRLFEAFIEVKPSFDFEEMDLLEIQSIILNLLDNDEFKDDNDEITHDYTTHILNSLQGKLLEALLKVTALWAEKFVEKDAAKKWNLVIEVYFTKRLTRTLNSDKDFSIILGVYLSWLIYFDKDWVYKNTDRIYDKTHIQHYRYTLYSSFSPMFRRSRGLYNFFNEKKVFTNAIEVFNNKSTELEILSTYALWEWIDLKISLNDDKGILFQMFKKQNFEQLESVIITSRKNKILAVLDVKLLVKYILAIIEENESLEPLRGDLLWLLEDIKLFDEELFNLSDEILGKKIHKSHLIYFFMRHILKIGDSNLPLSGRIIEKIVQQEAYTGNVENVLKQFVIKLYDSGNKTLADSICISVSEKGSLGLKEIYNKHN